MFFKTSLRQLYLEDERPWLVGFSGGKNSPMLGRGDIPRLARVALDKPTNWDL